MGSGTNCGTTVIARSVDTTNKIRKKQNEKHLPDPITDHPKGAFLIH